MVFLKIIIASSQISVSEQKNAVSSLLSLIFVFCGVVGVYLTLAAEFLGLFFLIVYVGAVAILFLFVVMLLRLHDKRGRRVSETTFLFDSTAGVLAIYATILFFATFFYGFSVDLWTRVLEQFDRTSEVMNFVSNRFLDILGFGYSMYTEHSPIFIAISLIILVAMIASVIFGSISGKWVTANSRSEIAKKV